MTGFGAVWLEVTVALLVAVAVLTNGGADTASAGQAASVHTIAAARGTR